MNILELLRDFPARVQGFHTSLYVLEDGSFRVLRKENIYSLSSQYTVEVYEGTSEVLAVRYFRESEDNNENK